MSEKHLGKIIKARFGIGGYQDAMLGLHVELSFGSCMGTVQTKSTWSPSLIECSPHAKWTEADRDKFLIEIMRYTDKILNDAKVKTVDQLAGKPVEVECENFSDIKGWRILTEVL